MSPYVHKKDRKFLIAAPYEDEKIEENGDVFKSQLLRK